MSQALLRLFWWWLIAAGLLLGIALPARAQTPIPPGPSPWSFEVTPYLWASGIHGDFSVRHRSATVDPSFSDLLQDLDFGAMLLTEVRYQRFGFLLDGMYLKSSKDADTPEPLFSGVDVTSQLGMVGPSLFYRAVLTDRFTLDVLGGVRIWIADTELDFKSGLVPGVKIDQSETWVDPVIGVRLGVDLTDRFFFTGLGDVGGFGAGSDLTWQALAGFGYRFNPHWSVTAGYRALGLDFSRGGFEMDIIMHGPVVGLGFRF